MYFTNFSSSHCQCISAFLGSDVSIDARPSRVTRDWHPRILRPRTVGDNAKTIEREDGSIVGQRGDELNLGPIADSAPFAEDHVFVEEVSGTCARWLQVTAAILAADSGALLA